MLILSVTFMVLMNVSCSKSNTTTNDEIKSDGETKETHETTLEPERVSVDEYGFDSKGRIVAYYGSPVIDGEVDEVWNSAEVVNPKNISSNVETTAIFKSLWDDNALYILVEVKDNELTVQSDTPYMQDSFEVFLDENNDKTQEYGVDDLHFRVNYENS